LNVFDGSLPLRQRSDAAPDDLEGQLGKVKVIRQFMQHPATVVASVHEAAFRIRKDECVKRGIMICSRFLVQSY